MEDREALGELKARVADIGGDPRHRPGHVGVRRLAGEQGEVDIAHRDPEPAVGQ